MAGTIANLAALVAGSLGVKAANPADFIPRFNDDEQKIDPEELEKRHAALRAADQRALAAGLAAMFGKKPNG